MLSVVNAVYIDNHDGWQSNHEMLQSPCTSQVDYLRTIRLPGMLLIVCVTRIAPAGCAVTAACPAGSRTFSRNSA
jgi:hypothetical protein